MKATFRRLYELIDERHPQTGSVMRKIYRSNPTRVRRMLRGRDNTISYGEARLYSTVFDVEGDRNTVTVGDQSLLSNVRFFIRGSNNRLTLGPRCRFTGSIWCLGNDCELTIGHDSTFENVHLAVTEPRSRLVVGRDCMFSGDIDVRTGDSHSIISQLTSERTNYAENVLIGDHVWVAAHCIILKGSVIPANCVVATGSIVTDRFDQEGIVIGGNPAKKIQEGITWTREVRARQS